VRVSFTALEAAPSLEGMPALALHQF